MKLRLKGIDVDFVLAFFLVCACLNPCKVDILAKDKQKENQPFALLMGSCFNERGFSLPGVAILVELKSEAPPKAKKRKWEMVSSPRGEFAVRLPTGSNTFLVTAAKKGFKTLDKSVVFQQDERQDIIFNMEPASE